MSDKQTRCPNCESVYKVTVAQLTVASGMVSCPKCSSDFNALINLVEKDTSEEDNQDARKDIDHGEHLVTQNHHVLDIFKRKVENSNIDLKTYLNNLNQFDQEPLNNYPNLNLSAKPVQFDVEQRNKNFSYYLFWFIVNFALIFALVFQILWFNPQLLNKYPPIKPIFNSTCNLFNCVPIEERYTYMVIDNLQLKKAEGDSTLFTGKLINNYSESVKLPLLQVKLSSKDQEINSFLITPNEYLDKNLSGINRIPSKTPFKFQFTIPERIDSFEMHEIKISPP